jgi:Fur family ferric uptake transcriptional regulator
LQMKTISNSSGLKQVANPEGIGKRVTWQRRLLLDLISQAGGHLDADELFRRAKEREPRISLSTVYRNLRLFKKLGLVDERHLSENHHHYEIKSPTEHYHLVCLGCGRVIEFESPLLQRMKNQIRRENQFEVTNAEIRLQGYCSRCQRKGSNK